MLNVVNHLLPFLLMTEIDFNSLDIPTPTEFINQYYIENIRDDFVVYLSALAAVMAVRSLGFTVGSPLPPILAATVISLINLLKILPRLASVAPFLCLILDHLLCPDMVPPISYPFR